MELLDEEMERNHLIKEQKDLICALRQKVQCLRQRNMGLQGDVKIIQDVLISQGEDVLARKAGKVTEESLRDLVMDLVKKCNAQSFEVTKKEKTLAGLKAKLQKSKMEKNVSLESDETRRLCGITGNCQKQEEVLKQLLSKQGNFKEMKEEINKEVMIYTDKLKAMEEKYQQDVNLLETLGNSEKKAFQRKKSAQKELNKVRKEAQDARSQKQHFSDSYFKAVEPDELEEVMIYTDKLKAMEEKYQQDVNLLETLGNSEKKAFQRKKSAQKELNKVRKEALEPDELEEEVVKPKPSTLKDGSTTFKRIML